MPGTPDPGLRSAALTSSFDTSPHLDAARAILAPQDASLQLPPAAATLHAAGIVSAQPVAPPSADAEQFLAAARQDLPFESPVALGLPIAVSPAMRPTLKAGPFEGPSGPFHLNLFGPAQTYSVIAAAAPRPTFVLTSGRRPIFTPSPYSVKIEAGTVWILASALAPGLPDDQYVGFTVGSGTLTIDNPLTIAADKLTYTGVLDAVLDVVLAPSPAGSACPAGVTVSGPQPLHLTWHAGGVTFALGPGNAKFNGNSFDLTAYVGPPRLDTELNIVFFPYTISPPKLDAATLSSDAATFSGTTALEGGWGLSLVKPDSSGHLGEALGPGIFVFYCHDVVRVKWPSAPGSIDLPALRLVVSQGQLLIATRHGSVSAPLTQTIRLWGVRAEPNSPRLPIRLHFDGTGIVFTYFCDATAGYGFYATCAVDLALDRPVTLSGAPLVFPGSAFGLFGVQHTMAGATFRVIAGAKTVADARKLIALRNALVAVSEPALILLQGALTPAGNIDNGSLRLTLGASAWLPTLPDPYVTNHSLGSANDAAGAPVGALTSSTSTPITATVTWLTPQTPVVTFQGTLGIPVGADAPQTANPTRPIQQSPDQIRVPTQTSEGSVIPSQSPTIGLTTSHVVAPAAATNPIPANTQKDLLAAFQGQTASAFSTEQLRGMRLLDVSTNQDLLGIELTGPSATVGSTFQLQNLDVCAPASSLRVFALPQVQWEPVRTLDRDQDIPHLGFFPTPLASVTDGGATQLAVQSVRLVPAIPDLATTAVLEEFAAGQGATLRTTLPFGLQALMRLRPKPTPRPPDTIQRNEPHFPKPGLTGGAQLAFSAGASPNPSDESNYFDGSTIQLLNGVSLATGTPLNISVLGSIVDPADGVESMFNNEFGPSGAFPKVPVTRLDISGYGGSNFSDWLKRSAAFAEAAKVQFQVTVGRTALEVVKFATVLYPWGIRLTRTVTIERRSGGGVIRRDSGWQASSPGLFQFPASAVPGTPYTVHPGLLQGLFNVNNIRSTGMAPISFMGANGKTVTLAPKFFDARARIDGLEGGPDLAANGILGYLQIEPVGEPLHENDIRALIDQQGPIGGPVDGVLQVGGSGFRVRATRIEVGYAIGGTAQPEFIGAVRSAPQFRQEGAWSAVRMPGPSNPHPDAEAVTANEVNGLPIVREGLLTGVSGDNMILGPQTDYRFADPADVHRPDDPVWEYGILQTSPAHVFVFPRPHVDPGIRELRTRTQPRFADYYARCTSKGLFPPVVNAVTLPANVLVVDPASGGFHLRDNVNMPAPRPPLIVAQHGSDVMQVDYSGANLSLTIAQNNWRMEMPGIEMWTDCLGISKVAGLRSHLIAGTNDRPVVRDIAMLLQHDIEAALTFLTGFGDRPVMGPMDLGASNTVTEHKFTVAVDRFWEFPPPPVETLPKLKLSVGGKAEFGWSSDDAPPPMTPPGTVYDIGLLVTAGVEGKIPIVTVGIVTVYLLLGAEIEIGGAVELKPSVPADLKFQFDLKAFLGVGVQVPAAAPIFDGSVSIGYHLAIDGGTVKNGIFGKVDLEVNLKIVKVSVEGEVGGLWYDLENSDPHRPAATHASDLEGEVQVNVEVLFITIHASYEYTETKYFG